jgi:hypothetical protein
MHNPRPEKHKKRGDIVCYDDAARERCYMSDAIVNPTRDAQPNPSLSWNERWSLGTGRGRGPPQGQSRVLTGRP